ncbi:hypothetical protein HLH34_00650 [Gluconacetobacter azotocaptans]|uniref:Uncharacterized protein n=1 Tax=Gluconacetobacter azotocaptans TaxID=142834 RepID=A0A7W4PDK4_9PROT|nr:hypothetical protein [Gluconacetobacter azotocaptans]MBB2188474.1 hypothetical protein [Gluconacetobacter azotocaptans]
MTGLGVQRIGATRLGRFLACLLVQVGLMLPFAVSGHAETMRQPMSGMAMAHMHMGAPHCDLGHRHSCHQAGGCCLQGACMADWIVPPFATRMRNPARATVVFGRHPAIRVAGVAFAPALPPPRQTA